ncbi:uncharacterized protein BJ212DRAFT_1302431 [Suillus subaureus]|uniref:Uncharacterized protein n=1 Tax=Suillus subaureus TaxID=48587 RepID=A0A9P7E2A9_9AGAM|nr:uncharacterized protein BJ212DRAFT_1302431 [Suillus subaureus]KAG1809578.1 hypothetical protein BJ212DRAFT_1302431 [Suillus subaureus]
MTVQIDGLGTLASHDQPRAEKSVRRYILLCVLAPCEKQPTLPISSAPHWKRDVHRNEVQNGSFTLLINGDMPSEHRTLREMFRECRIMHHQLNLGLCIVVRGGFKLL